MDGVHGRARRAHLDADLRDGGRLAHLEVNAECDPAVVLSTAQQLLTDRHQLAHFTLQVEPPGAQPAAASSAGDDSAG